MKALGFRQANAWLHTWVGLLLGWLLYAVFLTGTLSFFQEEITFWMKPELHASVPDNQTAQRLAQAMQSLAPNAAQWTLTLPGERNAGRRHSGSTSASRSSKGAAKAWPWMRARPNR